MIRWTIGGLIGGAIGAAIWWAVGSMAHREVGWIAWGIGFLVGFGVRYAANTGGDDESEGQGLIAGALAIGAVLFGKFLVYTALVCWGDNSELRQFADQFTRIDDNAMIAGFADEIATRMTQAGQQVAWPPGVTSQSASTQADYPPAIWQQATAQWKQLGPVGQQQKLKERLALASMLSQALHKPSFGDFFSLYDALWFFLATITAYKIGTGTYGTD
jgi:hypothetical protein